MVKGGAAVCELLNSTGTTAEEEEVILLSSVGRDLTAATIHNDVAMMKCIMCDWIQYIHEDIGNVM